MMTSQTAGHGFYEFRRRVRWPRDLDRCVIWMSGLSFRRAVGVSRSKCRSRFVLVVLTDVKKK